VSKRLREKRGKGGKAAGRPARPAGRR